MIKIKIIIKGENFKSKKKGKMYVAVTSIVCGEARGGGGVGGVGVVCFRSEIAELGHFVMHCIKTNLRHIMFS